MSRRRENDALDALLHDRPRSIDAENASMTRFLNKLRDQLGTRDAPRARPDLQAILDAGRPDPSAGRATDVLTLRRRQPLRRRALVAVVVIVAVLGGFAALGAANVLPDPVQQFFSDLAGKLGVRIPEPTADHGSPARLPGSPTGSAPANATAGSDANVGQPGSRSTPTTASSSATGSTATTTTSSSSVTVPPVTLPPTTLPSTTLTLPPTTLPPTTLPPPTLTLPPTTLPKLP